MTEKDLKKLNKNLENLDKTLKASFLSFNEAVKNFTEAVKKASPDMIVGVDMAKEGSSDGVVETNMVYTDDKLIGMVGAIDNTTPTTELTKEYVMSFSDHYDMQQCYDIMTNSNILIFTSYNDNIKFVHKVFKINRSSEEITDITEEYISDLKKRY